MQKYYYHTNGKQFGPFTKEELTQFNIKRDTLVWCDGMPDWKKANEVENLTDLFKNQPPPIIENHITPPTIGGVKSAENKDTAGTKTNYSWILWFLAGLIIILGIAFSNQNANQLKVDSMQKQIDSQQQYIDEQEAERLAEEERKAQESRKREYNQIKRQYDEAVARLRSENIELNQLQEFHFLRTPTEKQEQIDNQLDIIISWGNEVERLRKKLDQFN